MSFVKDKDSSRLVSMHAMSVMVVDALWIKGKVVHSDSLFAAKHRGTISRFCVPTWGSPAFSTEELSRLCL